MADLIFGVVGEIQLPCWMEKVDKEVADELARYQNQVGRELTREEIEEIHESPKMHCWIRWCSKTQWERKQ